MHKKEVRFRCAKRQLLGGCGAARTAHCVDQFLAFSKLHLQGNEGYEIEVKKGYLYTACITESLRSFNFS